MTPRYQVIWTYAAERDLIEIIQYISMKDPLNAWRIFKKIKQKASKLCTLPERGRIVPELQEQGVSHYREIFIPPWRLICRIAERKVFVLSVIDARRNVEEVLFVRYMNR